MSTEHKRQQVAFFDAEPAEFEIERPRGTGAIYEWLITDKLRRSVESIRPLLPGATALTVCGGSGMEAEFLAQAGSTVVCSDISLGAAERAAQRARRRGLRIVPVVADAERLPFRDRSFDLAYVHDGLHHLESPLGGLAEIIRVSRGAVSVNEPARAAVTAVAIRLGLAWSIEDAGNPVERLDPREVESRLRKAGYEPMRRRRYAMYYRQHPGAMMRVLSRRPLSWVAKACVGAFNRTLGRWGNKFTVQAIRPESKPRG